MKLFSEDETKKNILALSWRDIKAPKAGGAEVLSHSIFRRMFLDGYEVVHLSPMFENASNEENIDGIKYIRRGNSITVLWYAFIYYICNEKKIDYVIDQCNTHRFFTPLYVRKQKEVLFIHQLTREIWDINAKFPISWLGKHLETSWLRMYRKGKVLTVSNSTKRDLIDIGFLERNIYIMPNGIDRAIYRYQQQIYSKEESPTFIFVGRYVAYKGINICIEAFAIVKKHIPDAKLWLVGKEDKEYVAQNLVPLCSQNRLKLEYRNEECPEAEEGDIIIWGFVSEEKKYELMKKSTLLLFPSIREGWGIIITEAALLGTPSLVCDAPGMRDAVDYGKAGFICKERNACEFAEEMQNIVSNKKKYEKMQNAALEFSKKYVWDENAQSNELKHMEDELFMHRNDIE